MKEEDVIQFSDYLEGNLATSEKREFEERLRNDKEFAADFAEFKGIYRVLKNQHDPKREELKNTLKKVDKSFTYTPPDKENSPSNNGKSGLVWKLGIAATILVLVGLFLFKQNSSPEFHEYVPDEKISLTIRSEARSSAKKAEKEFNAGEYKDALIHLDVLLKEAPENSELHYYKARALIEEDQYKEADEILQELAEGDSAFANKALYLYGLSKLKQGDSNKAKSILKQLPESASDYDQAQKLIKKL